MGKVIGDILLLALAGHQPRSPHRRDFHATLVEGTHERFAFPGRVDLGLAIVGVVL
jgi:hypothetical protein